MTGEELADEVVREGCVTMEGDDGRTLVVTITRLGILVAHEGSGAVLWRNGQAPPDRFRLVEGGIPYSMSGAVADILASIYDKVQRPLALEAETP